MADPTDRPTILVLDANPGPYRSFYDALGQTGTVMIFATLEELLSVLLAFENRVTLLDAQTLSRSPTAQVLHISDLRSSESMALISSEPIENYLMDLRKWGLLQMAIKNDPIDPEEVVHFVRSVIDSNEAFGLYRYLSQKIEMCSISMRTLPEKSTGIERVINHFATVDFEVHDLYEVRLILEETLNNSFFHAFKTATGEEKYHIGTFTELAPEERIRVEFGSNGTIAGFTVTDNAGSLTVRTIINKLERQLSQEGLFDISGRGLYLSRMLTSAFIINIEAGKRTQVIALFDERRKTDRPKPFAINYIGPDTFSEWCLEPDMD